MRGFFRKHHMGIGIAVAVFLLTAILVLSVRIGTIEVSGSNRYSESQIEELLFSGQWGRNSTVAYVTDQLKPHRQLPFVENYKIVFHSPFHVEVIIYDKSIVGYVSYMSSYMYFDRDGIIVESSGTQLPGVPLVTGLEFGRVVLYQPLPVENAQVFENILNLTQQLSVYEIAVDRIQYDSHGNPTLSIGKMEVKLGSSADMDGKIATLSDILKAQPQLRDISGFLELDSYVESNNRAGITFKKK